MPQLTEHDSKAALALFGVPVNEGILVSTPEEAERASRAFGSPVMVKAQLPVGGRGKRGGVLWIESPLEASDAYLSVTSIEIDQLRATRARVEPWQECVQEFYLSVALSGEARGPVLIFSTGGGVDINEADDVITLPLDDSGCIPSGGLRHALYGRQFGREIVDGVLMTSEALARAFHAYDALLVELNPMGILEDGSLIALDARLIVDDHALYRQPHILALARGTTPRKTSDVVRDESRLEYVPLHGTIGLVSGGAGMTMAAMDLIADYGESPACFLDCSANPTQEGYSRALGLAFGTSGTRGVLINIFGGLTQVDRVARTLVQVLPRHVGDGPIAIRLEGTDRDGADSILRSAGFFNHPTLESAIEQLVTEMNGAASTIRARI